MPGLRKIEAAVGSMLYADVALDTVTRELGERLFTYEVPPHLAAEVFVGSQVLVPLAHQDMVAGYVVAIEDGSTRPKPQFKVRPIADVLESEPLFDREYVSFLHWVAQYYAASIADVIAAAVPADLGPKVKRMVRLSGKHVTADPAGIVRTLENAGGRGLSVKALKQRIGLPSAKFYAALAVLRQEGVLTVERESETKTAPKVISMAILTGGEPATDKQKEIVAALKRAGGQMPVSELVAAAGTTHGTIKRMDAAGIIGIVKNEVLRDPLANLRSEFAADSRLLIEGDAACGAQGSTHPGGQADKSPSAGCRWQSGGSWPELTADQEKVFAILNADLVQRLQAGSRKRAPQPSAKPDSAGLPTLQPWLLHGVTGSGKTEIYLRLIRTTLEAQKSALMLVPEISLTPQLAQRLVGRFGDLVAVWHSGLSPGERFDTWRRLRAGQARVLLGARSAVLANLPDLGLIVLDEEHDSSYKQSTPSPRYHAKTAALERARRCGAMLVLGSATPDVATYAEAVQSGRVVELPQRVFQQALPHSILVDMRQEYALGNRSVLSRPLQDAIGERLKKGEQTILLINRRGYASHVFCRACGFVTKCHHCSVSLVYHQTPAAATVPERGRSPAPLATAEADGYLMCHHCGFTTGSWITCPACHSPFVRQYGLGTQRVQEETQMLFPGARLLRLDSDVTSKRGAYEDIFRQFAAGQADILIGTQIVAKGLDIANVTLVGVLAADAAFNLPDYRSIERGFQLLTQVSGRAGRGQSPGQVFLQTFNVDMPALLLAKAQDYGSFVEQELESRRSFEYPPYSQIIRVVVAGDHEEEVETACDQLAEELSTYLEDRFPEEAIKIIGPAPCLIERLRGRYRHHLIVKNMAGDDGRKAVVGFLRLRRGTASLSIAVDVDAVDLI
jgi:primosomal protein N' (replication factor Y)